MDDSRSYLRTGDWVQVKSPAEIAQTLDAEGTLDGLPFMPEMVEYCCRSFRVGRVAKKACVEYPGRYWIRELTGSQVVFLEGLRCSGTDHDGCGRACAIFWKSAWLRKVDKSAPEFVTAGGNEFRRLTTKTGPNRYFCQSTELSKATKSLTHGRIVLNCLRDIVSGSRGVFEMAGLVLVPLWRKMTAGFPRRRLAGDLKSTPTAQLGLKPGELVTIKSAAEIARTLDAKGRNRGLICDIAMCQYSGRQYRVRNRLERMIVEPTGEMRIVDSTVILDDLECLCRNVVGGCPRQEPMYWREIWLERAEERLGSATTLGS